MKLRTRISLIITAFLLISSTILYAWNMTSTHSMVDNIREIESEEGSSFKRLTMIDTHEEDNDDRLLYGFVLVIAGGAAISYFVTGFALQPISELTDKISRYNPEDLDKHIQIRHKGDDDISSLLNAFNDMSDRMNSAFQREKRLSDSIAHEFRTPLAVLLSKYEVMEMKGDDVSQDEMKELIRLSKEKVEYLSSITSKLLVLNRELRAGSVDSISMDEIFEDLLLMHEENAEKRNIELEFHSDGTVLNVDMDLFTQMLSNFLENAIKYTPEGGKVSLDAESVEGNIVIRIKDNGIGIPDEHKSLVFEPFYRVDKSRSRATGGSGLGLVFAKEVINLYHGNVDIEDNIGGGTVFTLTFPCTKA